MKALIVILFNLVVLTLLFKIFFKNLTGFKKALYYFIKPDIISIIQKDYDSDFNYTHKMLFFLIVAGLIAGAEILILYQFSMY
ncbi:hypothetical protein [Niabella hibiscisoli]|uniref:hypothetical protein n=1 Tax=Niabella hibiscisoli TaxID=1825928 RepID=UPI001F0D3BCC|nr:hypothetical protein [Niabella hibiscisoli]MCH5720501.1 hypothetical protein [Niabella hibiscisoli]